MHAAEAARLIARPVIIIVASFSSVADYRAR
jgi:hypothetical protein